MGWCGSRPLHVVVADNVEAGEEVVVTVYEADTARLLKVTEEAARAGVQVDIREYLAA